MRFKPKGNYFGQTESKIGVQNDMKPVRTPGAMHGPSDAKAMQPKHDKSSEERTMPGTPARFAKAKRIKNIKRLGSIRKG